VFKYAGELFGCLILDGVGKVAILLFNPHDRDFV
jgi:hypothetical protein